ncbi:MAG: ergothioneine biosynthesis protein EgtC [Actinomycetota bacterium]|nr:ergothioneine biosynthesis protein EgtC [Actinomycetota bacterium]
MCRHLAYLGPPRTLADIVLTPPHSLLHQAYAPGDMRGGGTMNADGYGIGWYPHARAEPVRYRRAGPIWADGSLPDLARNTRSAAVAAAVRSATVGMPVVETAAAPFRSGRWLFSHNGVLPGWPASMERLARTLPVRDLMTLDAPTDSALLWALARARLEAGEDPVKAVTGIVHEVAREEPQARLNLLLLDGEQVVATAWYHALSVIAGDDFVAVCSEPWDDDTRWRPVPDRHLVTGHIGEGGPVVELCPLDD